jgi:Protein of unknown function (DUF3089)
MRRLAIIAVAVLALGAVAVWRLHAQPLGLMATPQQPFSLSAAPPAPDYSSPATWAAWPGRPSDAVVPPQGLSAIDPAAAKADVFFIHPTTYLANQKWNAAYDEPGRALTGVDNGVLGDQASVFNGCCRIYAPRYRQATFIAFIHDTPDGRGAIDIAYKDVERAFDYYIAHENHGRPFIIASHSQGSLHALRLLQDRIIGTPLQKRLVAAYVIGGFVPVEIEKLGLPICDSATQTGCVVDWNSVSERGAAARRNGASFIWLDGRYQPSAGRAVVCVDPLSWRANGTSPASANPAALPPSRAGRQALVPGVTGAACQSGGMLVVDIVAGERMRFFDPLSVLGIYHDLDYNLFYGSLRQNAVDRVNAFTAQ